LPALKKVVAAGGKAAKTARKAGSAAQAVGSAAGEVEGMTGGKKPSGSKTPAKPSALPADAKASKQAITEKKEDTRDRFKEKVRGHLEKGETLSDEDLKTLLESAGRPPGLPADWEKSCERVDLNSGDIWMDIDATILDQFADHCHNHLYTYKDEAREVDPGIDTETPQVGPTAQEIEKVNPAAVTEINGAKHVDTAKLAMTLAGAVGELARKMRRMEDRMESENEVDNAAIYLGTWGDSERSARGAGMPI